MMIRWTFVPILMGGIVALPSTASAQYYGGWAMHSGGAALVGSDYRQASAMQAKSQSMIAGQQAAMAQNAVVQSGIRNSQMNQAQERSSAILEQRQQTKDWWFQTQSSQMAQRPTGQYASAAPVGFQTFGPRYAPPPPVLLDVIQWPTLLQEECFRPFRTRVEAPYRRTPPKFSTPAPEDYRQMAATVEDMKGVLQWRSKEGADTNDYNTASAFLAALQQEVSQRSQAPQ